MSERATPTMNDLLLALAASLLLTLPANASGAKGSIATAAPHLPVVSVTAARVAEVVARVPVSGTLVAKDEVLVFPQVTGPDISAIKVDIGDTVKAGDVLAILDDRTLKARANQAAAELLRAEAGVRQAQSRIASAQASLQQAEAALGRTRALRKSGNTSQASLDNSIAAAASARAAAASARDGLDVAHAQLLQAKSQRDVAELNLERTRVVSPVDGIISARDAKIGGIAAAVGQPMFRIIRNGRIILRGEVIETALGAIRIGDKAELVISGLGNETGRVTLISPVVDPTTRLGTVRIAVDGHPALRTGVFASGWIITNRHRAITVPATAVLTGRNGDFVQMVSKGVVEKRAVTAGLLWQQRREIRRGLIPGEVVMVRAGAFFRTGDKVVPVTDTKATKQ